MRLNILIRITQLFDCLIWKTEQKNTHVFIQQMCVSSKCDVSGEVFELPG